MGRPEKEYKREPILRHMKARLVPPTPALPDCVCTLLLTDRHFYALEDEFDGTYTEHYRIPFSHLLSIERCVDWERASESGASEQLNTAQVVIAVIVSVIAGDVHTPDRSEKIQQQTYLVVKYLDNYGHQTAVYFNDCKRSIKSFAKAFERAKQKNVFLLD